MGNVADRVAENAVDNCHGNTESSAIDTNAKFCMTEGASEAEFGVLDDFFEGATTRIGYPNPDFMEGMEKEHCARNNSFDYFQTPNYKVTTCPRFEWQWVYDPNCNVLWDKFPGETGDSVVELSTSLEFESLELKDLLFLDHRQQFHAALRKELFCSCFGEISSIFWDPEPLKLSIIFNPSICWAVKDITFDKILESALITTFKTCSFGFELNIVRCDGQWTDGVDLQRKRKIIFDVEQTAIKTHAISRREKQSENLSISEKFKNELNENLIQSCFGKGSRTVLHLEDRTIDLLLTVQIDLYDAVIESSIVKAFTFVSGLQCKRKLTKSTKFFYSADCRTKDAKTVGLSGDTVVMTGRDRVGSNDELMKIEKVKGVVQKARILKEEVLALRLYTGPMYLLYNAKLRGFPSDLIALIGENQYETTLFVLISAIANLSKITDIPEKRVLYRGLGGKLLSQDFWKKSEGCQLFVDIKRKKGSDTAASVNLITLGQRMQLEVKKQECLEILVSSLIVDLALKYTVSELREKTRVSVKVEYKIVSLVISIKGVSKFNLLAEICDRAPPLTKTIQCVREHIVTEQGVEVMVDRVSDKPKDFQGGIELGMLSTTMDRSVALKYSGLRQKRAIVLEIEAGRIDLGASLSFLSQYPEEEEFLMPPLTCLEVKNPIRVETDSEGNEIVFVPVRANVNLKSMTIEEFSGLKKRMHLSSFSLLIEEIRVALNKIVGKDVVQKKWGKENPGIGYSLANLVEKIIQDCEAKRWEHDQKSIDEYKQEYFYRERVNEMLEMKTMAMSKLKLWTKNENERIPNIFNLQLREAQRKWVFFLHKKLEEAEVADNKVLVKKTAIRICKCKGLFEKGVDDTNDIGEVTMLRAAAEGESALTLKLLKLAGADINTGQSRDDDVVKERCDGIHGDGSNDAEINQQQLSIPRSAKTALMIAAENGHTNTVLVLHELNADISATSEGLTAQMLAAKNGHTETVLKLCELRANVHQVCLRESRKTSLMLAAENGHSDTVQALFDFGAKLWSHETDCSALCLAAKNGHIETVRLLCKLSNIQVQTVKNGLADLLAMARKGSASITDKLVSWETMEHLLLIRPASSSNFDHVISQSVNSKESTVTALKDLFHNVQKNHDFLQELKRARALVVGKTHVPGGGSADDQAEPHEDEESMPKTLVIDDVVVVSIGSTEKDGLAPLSATSMLEKQGRKNVYVEIKSLLDEEIEIWAALDVNLLELGVGDSSPAAEAAGSSGLEIGLVHDILGYGVVAAHGILEYRGLMA